MKKNFYNLLLTFIIVLMGVPMMAQVQRDTIDILYISNNEPADGGDAIVIDSLEAMGYNVQSIPAAAFDEFFTDDYIFDVLVIGESLSSSAVVPFATAGFPTPVVSLEGYCVRENRWNLASNDSFGQILPADAMPDIVSDPTKHFGITVNVAHPITDWAGLSAGQSVDWSDQRDSSAEVTYFNLPQASATAVARIQGESVNTLWAFEPDAGDATNPFQERAVIWGVHEFGLLQANDNFFNLLDGSILWTLEVIPQTVSNDPINVLYISNNEPADGGDAIVIDSLTALGYNVQSIPAAAFDEFFAADYIFDVLVIGESLSSSAVVPFATAGFPTPVVSLEGYCVRENRWNLASNDSFGQILPADAMPDIVSDPTKHFGITANVDHPITLYAGLSAGMSADWSDQRDSSAEVTYFNLPQASATAVASIQGESVNTLWAFEPDAGDATNPFQERAVIWGVHEFGLLKLNSTFVDLLDGSILWVLGRNTTAIEGLTEDARLNAYPNPFTTHTNIEFELDKAGDVSVELYDMTGRRVYVQSEFFGTGSQRMVVSRPASMTAGMYHFILRREGKAFGTGKVVAN